MNTYWEAFKTFFKIGIFTLGGGYAMIPIIEEEVGTGTNGCQRKKCST